MIRLNVFSYSSYLSTLIAKGEIKSPIVPYLPFVKDGEGEDSRKRPLHDSEPLSLSISIPALKKARTENNDSMEGVSSGISSPGGSSNFGGLMESFILAAPNQSDSPLMFQQDDQGVDENPALLQERAQKLQMLASTTDQYDSLTLVSPLDFNSPSHDNDAGGSPLSQHKVDPFSLSFFPEEEHHIDISVNKDSFRHLIFATYFPICDSHLSKQELNKRAVVLCGVGRMRQKVEAIVKKISEDIEHNVRLFANVQGNILPEMKLLPKFSSLPTFEQHVIAISCEKILRSSLSPVGSGSSSGRAYPACAQLVLVCELLKVCGGIHQIIELLVDIVECSASLGQEEGHRNVVGKSPPPLPSELCLDVIGLLQKYLPCLLLSQQNTTIIFEG